MVTKKDLVIVILCTLCLTSTLFMMMPTRSSSSNGVYDPWMDLNDDGVIDSTDLGMLGSAWGTTGTPINKTALLLELQAKVEALETRVPKKGYVSLPPAAFVPESNTIQAYDIREASMKGGPSAWFHAPLQLPQGAIITNITAYLYDGMTTGKITVYLVEWNQTKLHWNSMVTLDSGFVEAPGQMVLFNDTIVHSGIDNKNCIYIVSVWFSNYDNALLLYDVFIEYEYLA